MSAMSLALSERIKQLGIKITQLTHPFAIKTILSSAADDTIGSRDEISCKLPFGGTVSRRLAFSISTFWLGPYLNLSLDRSWRCRWRHKGRLAPFLFICWSGGRHFHIECLLARAELNSRTELNKKLWNVHKFAFALGLTDDGLVRKLCRNTLYHHHQLGKIWRSQRILWVLWIIRSTLRA